MIESSEKRAFPDVTDEMIASINRLSEFLENLPLSQIHITKYTIIYGDASNYFSSITKGNQTL